VTRPRRWRHFSTDGYGSLWGVYTSFAEARAAAPKTKGFDYDNPLVAKEYAEEIRAGKWERVGTPIRSFDYPPMLWLQLFLERHAKGSSAPVRVIDFGGSVGVHYYEYRRYLSFPASLTWTICDLPCIVAEGEILAKERTATQLRFATDIRAAGDADLFLASASLQAVDDVAALLTSLPKLPQALILNRLPLYDGPRFVTLQNGGHVFYCQNVFNRNEFIASLKKLGYELRDEWVDTVDSCSIPFHPTHSFPHCIGLYMELPS